VVSRTVATANGSRQPALAPRYGRAHDEHADGVRSRQRRTRLSKRCPWRCTRARGLPRQRWCGMRSEGRRQGRGGGGRLTQGLSEARMAGDRPARREACQDCLLGAWVWSPGSCSQGAPHMVLPSTPSSSLVRVQPRLSLDLLAHPFCSSSLLGAADQLLQDRGLIRVGQCVASWFALSRAPPNEKGLREHHAPRRCAAASPVEFDRHGRSF
jgi:hypothetical protein